MRPLRWWAESAPLGWDRVRASENLGATAVAPVAPVVTSLLDVFYFLPFFLSPPEKAFAQLPVLFFFRHFNIIQYCSTSDSNQNKYILLVFLGLWLRKLVEKLRLSKKIVFFVLSKLSTLLWKDEWLRLNGLRHQ